MRSVAREAIVMSSVGVIAGLGLAAWFVRLISARLYGVEPTDPVSMVLVAAGVLLVAVLAAAVPARRAGLIDPA
jgi:putative ABC transport system permease protein